MFGIVMGLLLVAVMFTFASYNDIISSHKFYICFKNFTESCIVNDDYSEICSFVYKAIKENHTRSKDERCAGRFRFDN